MPILMRLPCIAVLLRQIQMSGSEPLPLADLARIIHREGLFVGSSTVKGLQ